MKTLATCYQNDPVRPIIYSEAETDARPVSGCAASQCCREIAVFRDGVTP